MVSAYIRRRVDDLPVAVQDAVVARRAARPPVRVVVLQPAVHEVRVGHVEVDVVELLDRDVRDEGPVVAVIPGRIQAAVVAEDHVRRVLGVDPQVVVVHVHAGVVHDFLRNRGEVLAAVGGPMQRAGDQIHGLVVVGIGCAADCIQGRG